MPNSSEDRSFSTDDETLDQPPSDAIPETHFTTPGGPSTEALSGSLPFPGGPGGGFPFDFGDYQIVSEIARGGMGVVYEARHRLSDRVVALKMILANRFASSQAIERFHVEAKAAAALDHPGIVPIYDIGEVEGQHYFTMALVDGGSLQDQLREGPLPPNQAAKLVEQIAEAVQHAHDQGIIHRDLKPQNILLSGKGKDAIPRLTDFGLARVTEGKGLTVSGDVLGTPAYMPPEQASGSVSETGAISDVYSLGAVLYCLLTGHPPFQSASPYETMRLVIQKEPVPLRSLNPEVPCDLETVCLKCLQKEPSRRYGSAAELAEDLQRFQQGIPVLAHPVSRWEKGWRWCKRNPLIAALLGAIALLIVSGTTVSTIFGIQATQQARRAEKSARNAIAQQQRAEKAAEEEKKAHQLAEQRLVMSEAATYAIQLSLAQKELEGGEVEAAKRILAQCKPELRHWEHGYLRGRADRLRTRYNYEEAIAASALSPDGQLLATGMASGSVLIRDLSQGRVVRHCRGHQSLVTSAAFSPRGGYLATGGSNGSLRVWDPQSGKQQWMAQHKSSVQAVAFSPNGTLLASAGFDGSLLIHHAISGKLDRSFQKPKASIYTLVWNKESTEIFYSGGDRSIHRIDAITGMSLKVMKGHFDNVLAIRLNPDGRRIASGGFYRAVRVWDVREGRQLFAIDRLPHRVFCLAWSPDGRYLAAGLGGLAGAKPPFELYVWDMAQNGRLLLRLRGHQGPIRDIHFTPNGNQLISASSDKTVAIWDVRPEPFAKSLGGFRKAIAGVDVTSNGERIVAVGGDPRKISSSSTIRVWQSSSGEEVASFRERGDLSTVLWHPNGNELFTGNRKQISLWSMTEGRIVRTYQGHTGRVMCLGVSPDHQWMASGSTDKSVRLWPLDQGRMPLVLNGHEQAIVGVGFLGKGSRLLSVSREGAIRIWNVKDGKLQKVSRTDQDAVECISVSEKGSRIAMGYRNGRIQLFDRSLKGQGMLIGHTGSVTALDFSADGKRILSGSSDGTVKIWEAKTGQNVLTLITGSVRDLAIDRQSHCLVTGGRDSRVRLWKVQE